MVAGSSIWCPSSAKMIAFTEHGDFKKRPAEGVPTYDFIVARRNITQDIKPLRERTASRRGKGKSGDDRGQSKVLKKTSEKGRKLRDRRTD